MRDKLLIVEGDASVMVSLEQFFREQGYRVRTAMSGFEALAEIHDNVPDILLSGLHMRGMSGFDLLAVVRRRFPQIRLVAMSGSVSKHGVPYGVPAPAVYQKGTGTAALLQAVEARRQ